MKLTFSGALQPELIEIKDVAYKEDGFEDKRCYFILRSEPFNIKN